ncbi:MAG: phospholipase [Proteobacteria bacterium]|nr:phospholipase [Pseudomonadota bacterium]
MEPDTDQLLEATTALIPPLLTALDALGHAGRYLHPPELPAVIERVLPYRDGLADGLTAFTALEWPDHLKRFEAHCVESAQQALQAFDGLAGAADQANPAMGAYRAMGANTRAVEALYPVSLMLPPVSRFFLNEPYRDDAVLLEKLASADAGRDNVGVMHAANTTRERGGFSMYVPEYYQDEKMPLIVAMHGGSGHGRGFLWTWIREARTRGAIVLSPTSQAGTWSLMGPDIDSENLDRMVLHVREYWNIDNDRILLTGMSDGGTFSYVTGLRANAPFTHLAPSSASFHPMLIEFAERELKGLPIYLMHGVLDWMFPVDVARTANDTFTRAGADVVYREIDDLSHTYPREENARIMDWLLGG